MAIYDLQALAKKFKREGTRPEFVEQVQRLKEIDTVFYDLRNVMQAVDLADQLHSLQPAGNIAQHSAIVDAALAAFAFVAYARASHRYKSFVTLLQEANELLESHEIVLKLRNKVIAHVTKEAVARDWHEKRVVFDSDADSADIRGVTANYRGRDLRRLGVLCAYLFPKIYAEFKLLIDDISKYVRDELTDLGDPLSPEELRSSVNMGTYRTPGEGPWSPPSWWPAVVWGPDNLGTFSP